MTMLDKSDSSVHLVQLDSTAWGSSGPEKSLSNEGTGKLVTPSPKSRIGCGSHERTSDASHSPQTYSGLHSSQGRTSPAEWKHARHSEEKLVLPAPKADARRVADLMQEISKHLQSNPGSTLASIPVSQSHPRPSSPRLPEFAAAFETRSPQKDVARSWQSKASRRERDSWSLPSTPRTDSEDRMRLYHQAYRQACRSRSSLSPSGRSPSRGGSRTLSLSPPLEKTFSHPLAHSMQHYDRRY